MFNTNRNPSLLPLLLLLFCGLSGNAAYGQASDFIDIRPKLNSPLSRFGLGNPVDQFFAAQAGMGGLERTYQDAFQWVTH